MKTKIEPYLILGLLILLGGLEQGVCAESPRGETPKYIDGLNRPEDLLNIPQTPWIIASGMGRPGSIYSIHAQNKFWKKLSIGFSKSNAVTNQLYKDCPAPLDVEQFSPHGINMRFDKDQGTLYVVNHGRGETIEIFSMTIDLQGPAITWIGCIIVPEKNSPNSITPLPDGGLAITSIRDPSDKESKKKHLNGEKTGKILEWHFNEGWKIFPGSELSGNNGIEISPDGRWYYIAEWSGRALSRLSRNQNSPQKETVNVNFMPDNIRWSDDGYLIIAGHGPTAAEYFNCRKESIPCSLDSTIVEVDPKTLEVRTLREMPGDEKFGTASVAIKVGNEVFVSSFRKSRISYFDIDANQALHRTSR